MEDTLRLRFSDAPWFPKGEEFVIVGGAGGIGSWLVFLLARAGFSPIVWDFDNLEEHNLGGQLYPEKSVGQPKVAALQSLVQEFSRTHIDVFAEKYTKETETHVFVLAAYDNMQARRDTFENWRDNMAIPWLKAKEENNEFASLEDKREPIFIDGRLTMEQVQIYAVRPRDIKRYDEEALFDDSEVEDAPCTLKQTSHTAAIIGGLMVSIFNNHYANVAFGEEDREVPFFTEFFSPIMFFKVE